MKVTEIVVSRAVKINTAPYESTDVFASMKLTLEDMDLEDFSDQDRRELQAHVRDIVLDEVEHIVREKGMGDNPSRKAIAKRWGLGS